MSASIQDQPTQYLDGNTDTMVTKKTGGGQQYEDDEEQSAKEIREAKEMEEAIEDIDEGVDREEIEKRAVYVGNVRLRNQAG